MRKVYNVELLRQLHLARYVYFNEDFDEIYAWFNGPEIKILDYLGETIGHSSIENSETGEDYSNEEIINPRDIDTTVDKIVSDLYQQDE